MVIVGSLSMYIEFRRNVRKKSAKARLENVDALVECISSEIMSPPYDLNKSSFIVETDKLLKTSKDDCYINVNKTQISTVDAYIVIKMLINHLENSNSSATNSPDANQYVDYLFTGAYFEGSQKNELNKISNWLGQIGQIVQNRQTKLKLSSQNSESEPYKYSSLSEQSEEVIGGAAYSVQPVAQMQELGANAQSGNKTFRDTDDTIAIRAKNNATNIQKWHENISSITAQLQEIQPIASKVLKKLMSFSADITEGYVLQFARMQVELFNLISDNYDFHVQASNKSHNNNYINAVNNYSEFLDAIIDSLSVFGIEEIKSDVGTNFNGSIHEVVGDDGFSPSLALVKKSIRSGFRYKDIVIQKEKINV